MRVAGISRDSKISFVLAAGGFFPQVRGAIFSAGVILSFAGIHRVHCERQTAFSRQRARG